MDIGDYGTNVLLINGIKSVAFRVYEPSPEQSQYFSTVAPDVDGAFHNEGRVFHFDASRRALFQFHLADAEGPVSSEGATGKGGAEPEPEIKVAGATLILVEEGSFEPASLFKGRIPSNRSANTPSGTPSSGTALEPNQRSTATGAAGPNSAGLDEKIISTSTVEDRICSTTIKDAYERFVTAVLSTVSVSLCSRLGAIPLNHRTLLLNSKVTRRDPYRVDLAEDAGTIGILRVYLTSTGCLVISMSVFLSEGLVPINEVPSAGQIPLATQVLAAPFGVLGIYQGLATGALHDPFGQTPDTKLWRLRGGLDARSMQWRDMCTRILRGRGLSAELLENCTWIALQLCRRKSGDQKPAGHLTPNSSTSTIISWPSILCFRKKWIDQGAHANEALAYLQSDVSDCLAEAQTWFQTESERGENVAQRRREREAAATKENLSTASSSARPLSGQSPMDARRAANAAAAGAMYPTPPDAVQNLAAATPAGPTEGNTSSPVPPTSVVPPVHVEPGPGNTNIVAGSEGEGDTWESAEGKREERERGDSPFGGDGENIFGELEGPDMFGDADITDADFNFFDDQPGNGSLSLSGMPDLDMTDEPVSMPPPEPSKQDLAPKALPEDVAREKMPPPSSPVFAKPELKHARSSLRDDAKASAAVSGSNGIKRAPSPFDPDTVFKKVRASLHRKSSMEHVGNQPTRKGSIFDGVEFDPDVPLSNKKYEAGGRFDYRSLSVPDDISAKGKTPTTGYLKRHGKQSRRAPRSADQTNALIRTITGTLENSTLHGSPEKMEEATSDADDISLVSDQDDSPDMTEEPLSPLKASTKRLNLDDDMASHATSMREVESVMEDSDPSLALELPRLARTEAPEVAVGRFFDQPEPLSSQLVLRDEDFITVAQILTEQAVSGTFHCSDTQAMAFGVPPHTETRRQLASLSRTCLQALKESIPSTLGKLAQPRLKGVAEVADIPLHGPSSRFQPRPVPSRDPNAEPPKPSNPFTLPTPHLELKRLDAKLSVLPSSVSFWETLGLGPSQGGKEVNAICVFLNTGGMSSLASSFLGRLRHTYEFLKLGSFETLPACSPRIVDGLVPWTQPSPSLSPSLDGAGSDIGLEESMETLNQCLMSSGLSNKNFVVYFVYSPSRPGSIVESCVAFQRLFEMQKKSLAERRQPPKNELVLQLIPVSFLTSVSGMPSAEPEDIIKLALETYDRCTLFGGPMPAPAIVLEQNLPRTIDFRLNTTASSSLMHENTCIHIAYAQSVDERWVTAAWTDNRGSQQMMASYNLGRKGKPLSTALNDVAHEIWETTHDLISRWRVHWRVIITKCGAMDSAEVDFWVALAQTESHASVTLTLMAVDTNPSLQLLPASVKVPTAAPSSFYSTPASTPQPVSTVSPDHSGTPATPAAAATPATGPMGAGGTTPGGASEGEPPDGDAILVDVTDQSWGAVLSHRLSTSPAPGELGSVLVSGYLIKRGGKKTEDPPAVMEVNILHSDGNPRAYESLMREMLSYFRGLGTLARARGVVDREGDVRPWHVAAAEKGARALYLLM